MSAPAWICHACGLKWGHGKSGAVCGSVATFHMDTCGICGAVTACTEPRDYGYLREGWQCQNPESNPKSS